MSPFPFCEKNPPKTGSEDAFPRGQTAVTPVRTLSPDISVLWPTSIPGTSTIALSGPVVPSNGTPRPRARGLVWAPAERAHMAMSKRVAGFMRVVSFHLSVDSLHRAGKQHPHFRIAIGQVARTISLVNPSSVNQRGIVSPGIWALEFRRGTIPTPYFVSRKRIMGLALNQVIGAYECLGVIDRPKVGITYKVRNRLTGEVELLRTLPGGNTRDREAKERLLREIRIQARLSHPNIVEFHDAFEIDGQMVMTTEFVEAPTLAEFCRSGSLPSRTAMKAAEQVLDGLEQAHALGIVHRGITAEHVAITREGIIKLSGFDLAKPEGDTNLTRVGVMSGDARYISPEQVEGRPADARSDLYSVGILLYQMLTGRLPFDGKSDVEVLIAQAGSEPPAPRSINPAISPVLERVVLKALRKNPDQRFASAEEFRAALQDPVQAPPAAPAKGPVLVTGAGKREPRRGFKLQWVIGAVAVAAVVVWFVVRTV
jgi:hypothetical protein